MLLMSTWGNRGAVAKSRCARSLTDTHAGLGLSLLGSALQRSSETQHCCHMHTLAFIYVHARNPSLLRFHNRGHVLLAGPALPHRRSHVPRPHHVSHSLAARALLQFSDASSWAAADDGSVGGWKSTEGGVIAQEAQH
jgi:hypothetical protein